MPLAFLLHRFAVYAVHDVHRYGVGGAESLARYLSGRQRTFVEDAVIIDQCPAFRDFDATTGINNVTARENAVVSARSAEDDVTPSRHNSIGIVCIGVFIGGTDTAAFDGDAAAIDGRINALANGVHAAAVDGDASICGKKGMRISTSDGHTSAVDGNIITDSYGITAFRLSVKAAAIHRKILAVDSAAIIFRRSVNHMIGHDLAAVLDKAAVLHIDAVFVCIIDGIIVNLQYSGVFTVALAVYGKVFFVS